MLARVWTCALQGLEGRRVLVEVDIHDGLPSVSIVGLPGQAVREAKDRLIAGLRNAQFTFPLKRVTFNLAPGDLPKSGPGFDLPMAMGLLLATGQVTADVGDALFYGELALDGTLRHCPGVLPVAAFAERSDFRRVVVPVANGAEASLVDGVEIVAAPDIGPLARHLSGGKRLPPPGAGPPTPDPPPASGPDLAEVRGQAAARRALEVAAAGAHNLLFTGPPGAGKTMLARCLPSILPALSTAEALEVTAIHSVANQLPPGHPLVSARPFRSPHHTVSAVALTGGGGTPRPGEVSLAHLGVLFLDELPEFDRRALEALRGPLEDRRVTVTRAAGSATFPARFSLVAARNPCPCGLYGDRFHACQCPPHMVDRYQRRVSGPLLDRVDVHATVPRVEVERLLEDSPGEPSAAVRSRVEAARERQRARLAGRGARSRPVTRATNADLTAADLRADCHLTEPARRLVRDAATNLGLSARAFARVLKVARTLADLEEADLISDEHLAEAFQYRPRAN